MEIPASKSSGAEKLMTNRRRENREKKMALMQDVSVLHLFSLDDLG